jgi:hypothetical protein
VLAVSAALAVSVSAVVLSLQLIEVTSPVPLSVAVTTQLAMFVCVFGKLSVASVPVVVLVPVVSAAVPLTPSHTWLVTHANVAPDPADAPAPSDIVPEPIMNLPETNPVAVVLPFAVVEKTAAGLDPPLST